MHMQIAACAAVPDSVSLFVTICCVMIKEAPEEAELSPGKATDAAAVCKGTNRLACALRLEVLAASVTNARC